MQSREDGTRPSRYSTGGSTVRARRAHHDDSVMPAEGMAPARRRRIMLSEGREAAGVESIARTAAGRRASRSGGPSPQLLVV